ncbi:T7SS effector LXG polymorphic toxin [Enterococcus rivorum]|uniref:LXG domain-containing protein n=1 Tax=Enterococcus rivorum TaxID=762845 RepID=A0A1E5KTC3_9ENTE|nr:T7SS effector LXG polymorphic toxin [Enterococcus rivorum]MBP2099105.1 uncharacterized protein YukE [Enterococcus rivorum]OEH81103.1 hypothetical protein BCR26_17695 [Enterococcus rivorum]
MSKIKISEIQDWSNSFASFSTSFNGKLNTLKSSTNDLATLDSFSGNGASSVKNYLKDTHSKLADSYKDVVETFSDELKRSLTDFSSQVDNSSSCVIKKSEIETFKTTIETQYKTTKEQLKSINTAFSSVSSICSVSKIELTEANEAWTALKKIIQTMFEKLQAFESSFSGVFTLFSTQLESLNHVSSTMGQIGSVGLNNYNARNFTKLNKAWTIFGHIKDGKELGGGLKFFYQCIENGSLVLTDNANGKKVWMVTTKELYDKIGTGRRAWGANSKFRYVSEAGGKLKPGVADFFENNFKLPNTHYAFLKPSGIGNTVKGVGKAIGEGAISDFKPNNFKGLGKVGKGLFIANVGMSAWDNFSDAHNDSSLSKMEANIAGTINTATDLAVSGAVWGGSMATAAAIGTAICPGAGTIAGVAITAGAIVLSWGFNEGLEKFGVKDAIKDVGKEISKKIGSGIGKVSNFFKNPGKNLAGFFG